MNFNEIALYDSFEWRIIFIGFSIDIQIDVYGATVYNSADDKFQIFSTIGVC